MRIAWFVTLSAHFHSENVTSTSAPDVNQLSLREYATCSMWSRDHFRSFDETDFSINGDCTYTLAAATDGTFDVTVKNIDCYTLDSCYKVGEKKKTPAFYVKFSNNYHYHYCRYSSSLFRKCFFVCVILFLLKARRKTNVFSWQFCPWSSKLDHRVICFMRFHFPSSGGSRESKRRLSKTVRQSAVSVYWHLLLFIDVDENRC